MALLPELLFRASFGKPLLRERRWPSATTGACVLGEDADWSSDVLRLLPHRSGSRIAAAAAGLFGRRGASLGWMPAAHYAPWWPRMRAFALPSFYDGRIRLNLKGRERRGLVEPADYETTCATIERLLRDCVNPADGGAAVAQVIATDGDPFRRGPSEPDLTVLWNGSPLALSHPVHGSIGPLPYRRTGGHTGGDGVAYFFGPRVAAGATDRRDAFDVVPTALELLGCDVPEALSGSSFAPLLRRPENP